jgi:hypothetical protein
MSDPENTSIPYRSTSDLVYDGPETPVLIQMPDLAPPSQTHLPATESSPAAETAEVRQQPNKRTRRIHRSHVRQPTTPPIRHDAHSDLRTKLIVVAALIAVVGVTYVLLHRGGGDAEPSLDHWVRTPDSVEPSAGEIIPEEMAVGGQTEETNDFVDLWPGDASLEDPTLTTVKPSPPTELVSESAVEMPSVSNLEPETAEVWPVAPGLQTPTSQQPETPVSWSESPDDGGNDGWPESNATLNQATSAPGVNQTSVNYPVTANGGFVQAGSLQHAMTADQHYTAENVPSTARLDGKIVIPRPANAHAEPNPRLY